MTECTQYYKTATFYYNLIWYPMFFSFLLNKRNKKIRYFFAGMSLHIIPFIILSHFILYHTDYIDSCKDNLNRSWLHYMFFGDILPHWFIFILYLIYFKKINKKIKVDSPYFLGGFITVIGIFIIFGCCLNWNKEIYKESFIVLSTLYFLILFLTFTILLKEKNIIKKDDTKNMLLL